jgi:septal ring factor EnvC (AmiA/AmiB activator)
VVVPVAVAYFAAVMSAIATLIGAVVGVQAYRAKRVVDQRTVVSTEVTVSLAALKAALERSDTERLEQARENERLHAELCSLRAEFDAKLDAQRVECEREIGVLHDRIRELTLGRF